MGNPAEHTKTSFQPAPGLLSKKVLSVIFGITDSRTLWSKVLTEEVCLQAGLDREALRSRSVRIFDALTSEKLKQVLKIQ